MDHIGIDVHKGKVRFVPWPREASWSSDGSARSPSASPRSSGIGHERGA